MALTAIPDDGGTPQDNAWDDLLTELYSGDEVRVTSPDFPDLIQLVDEGILTVEKQSSEKIRMEGFHPSFVSGRSCINAFYHHHQREKSEPFSPHVLRIMDNGTSVHRRLQKYLKNHLYGSWKCGSCHKHINLHTDYYEWALNRGILSELDVVSHSRSPEPYPGHCPSCGSEYIRYNEWRVIDRHLDLTGETDGILRGPKGNLLGLEIKSANSNSFKRMVESGSYPLPKYREQFVLYLKVLDLEGGLILLENKDNQELAVIPVYAAEQDLSHLFEKMSRVLQIEQGTESLPEPVKNSECSTCPYFKSECTP